MFFLLALVAITSGALMTYFYDEDAPLYARLCAGVCTGFAAWGLAGFVCASFFGLNAVSLALATAIIAAPLALLWRSDWRARVRYDINHATRWMSDTLARPRARTLVRVLLFVCGSVMLWLLFGRAMFVRGGEIFTGVDNNLGDLPFHISIINSFVEGQNFPPQHPEYAGARLTYPFIVDFVAAMFVRAGASLEAALFWQNFLLGLSLVGLLYRFALKLTGNRVAATFAPVLTLLSGGLGWLRLLSEWQAGSQSLTTLLWNLPHDYTISFDGVYRWGNALTTLFVPQRGLLLGLPLALIVITQWWMAVSDGEGMPEREVAEESKRQRVKSKKQKGTKEAESFRRPEFSPLAAVPFLNAGPSLATVRMIAASVVAGLLPLIHAHSFVTLMLMGGCLALLFPRWRVWPLFFVVAFVIAAPQMWWATRESAARPESFFAWQFGWDRGTQNVWWFWLNNTGLFIPLLIAAMAWRGREPIVPKKLLLFYAPFVLLFIIGNAGKISPWIWDNIKVLFYWYVASAPLVALLLARLWQLRGGVWWGRTATLSLLLVLTLAGSLDVWRVVSEASEQREFDRAGVAFGELLKNQTEPRSLILHAPTYNHPSYLSGRRSLMGYGGHLWSQGINYAPREAEIKQIYAGGAMAESLLAKYGVDYIVVGPLERSSLTVNENFFQRFQKVGETVGYRLYKVARP